MSRVPVSSPSRPLPTCSCSVRTPSLWIHGNVALAPERQGNTPVVDLDSKLYKLVDSLDGLGLPSLTGMDKLTLRGRFHFHDGAVLRGTLLMENDSDETKEILPGVYAGA